MPTARSIGPSNITRLQKERSLRTLKRDPQFAALLNAYLLSRVIRVEEDLADQFFNFSEKRLARVLLLFGQITKESKPENPLKAIPRRILEARKAAGERAVCLIREAADAEPELQDLVYANRVLDELERKCQSA